MSVFTNVRLKWVSKFWLVTLHLLALAFSAGAFADQLPMALSYRGEKVVFLDLIQVKSNLTIDAFKKTAAIQSQLTLRIQEEGRPFIMLPAIAQAITARLSDRQIQIEHLRADESSPLGHVGPNGYLLEKIKPGFYNLDLNYSLPLTDHNLLFNKRGEVDFFTVMSDLKESQNQFFLDATFPTNLLYDTYKFELQINVLDESKSYDVLANGAVRTLGRNQFELKFPGWYVSDSFFIHLFKKDSLELVHTSLKRLEGPDLKTTVECEKGQPEICRQVLNELQGYLLKHEGRLGPYPHDQLIVRICQEAPCHSMEYSGAFETRYMAGEHVALNLEHELLHSWFGRSVQFRSGGDSWLDEALVVWAFIPKWPDVVADRALVDSLCEIPTYPYAQYTSGDPYRWGPQILERLDHDLVNQGGLLPVLRRFHDTYKHSTIGQREFFDFVIKSAADVTTKTKLTADLAEWYFE